MADRLEYPRGDLLGQHVVDADHPAQRARSWTLLQRVAEVAGEAENLARVPVDPAPDLGRHEASPGLDQQFPAQTLLEPAQLRADDRGAEVSVPRRLPPGPGADHRPEVEQTLAIESLRGRHERFTGIKPAGSVDPAIAAADRALSDGNIEPLADKFAAAVRDAIKKRFAEAHRKRQVAETSVEQGRAYVETYVEFTHFVESVDHLVVNGASHKHRETEETP